jgi:hypothetical protein
MLVDDDHVIAKRARHKAQSKFLFGGEGQTQHLKLTQVIVLAVDRPADGERLLASVLA